MNIKTRLLVLISISLLVSARCEPVVVTVDANAPGPEISPDFIGLSYEMSALLPDSGGRYFFSGDNKPLIQLFRSLGIKSLRVGGNTADRPSVKVPGPADIDSLFAFARSAGVKVLYTLRLNEGEPKAVPVSSKAGGKETLQPYDPKADARIANYILDHYAANLACFIIGNEPDHYYADFPSYRQAWERFAGEITSPAARFCGPSTTAGHVSWAGDFARELGRGHRVAFITQHEYAAGSGRIADIAVAREKLLSPRIEGVYQKFYDSFVPAVLQSGRHFRLEECNSFSNGGARGVSDAFAASLWGVDYMYWWAAHGASGVNFHTSGANSTMQYAVFLAAPDGGKVRPLGYAVKAFDLGSHGRLVPAQITPSSRNLRAWAVRAPNGALSVTLINKEYTPAASPLEVTLVAARSGEHAQVQFLSAANGGIDARTGITLGRSTIEDDGTWNGQWTRLQPQSDSGHFVIALPPASVAIVKFD